MSRTHWTKGKLRYPKGVDSITPEFAVDKGYITGEKSIETKKKILNTYGTILKERLIANKGYSIVFENNGSKFRDIHSLSIKRTERRFYNNHFNRDYKPTMRLKIETSSMFDFEVNGRMLREALSAIPANERYKFPKA